MSFPWIITEHIVKTKRAMALGWSSSTSKTAGSADNSTHGGIDGSEAGGGKGGGSMGGDSDGPSTPYGKKKSKKKGKGGSEGGMGHVLVEEVLWALDLYNDAAYRALYVLNSQYLFNEIQVGWRLVPTVSGDTLGYCYMVHGCMRVGVRRGGGRGSVVSGLVQGDVVPPTTLVMVVIVLVMMILGCCCR